MVRLTLILVVLALSACVARESSPRARPALKSTTSKPQVQQRQPLPAFHPEYKTGSPYYEYNEHTEDNLRRLSALAQRVVSLEIWSLYPEGGLVGVPLSKGSDSNPGTQETRKNAAELKYKNRRFDDARTISDIRWAFSGNLMEARRHTDVLMTKLIFRTADHETIEVFPAWEYAYMDFPGATWTIIRWTPEMAAAIAGPMAEFEKG